MADVTESTRICGADFGGSMEWGRICTRPAGHRWSSGCSDDASPRWLQRFHARQDRKRFGVDASALTQTAPKSNDTDARPVTIAPKGDA